ncbi:isoprenylcysteine carboxyl methyltransferase family protein [Shouchella lonarensis]|uniref:15-methylpalmitoyl-4-hydroxy-2-pyrone 4-O-methyltransferase n=1 Tax=Shouchella lonarensis TaxID=1464122 RepID=A0A1G6MRM3_9BACI|nr:isoprenylcysteine carboxyl methyltransferase family protein [Shouchella lonarensis]SDC57625.1 15-methylpalmitoyl-4-hydroxy-2-pyrone 4-O-methyltransferase [Shouchella lonarensis]
MTIAYMIIGLLIAQRLVEVLVAKRNERWLKAHGGIEIGARHYPFIVGLHALFFVSLIAEVRFTDVSWQAWTFIPLVILVGAQVIRIWALSSLGKFWNTKIIVLPGAKAVTKGPYRFIRHPNYVVVILEIACIPLLFQAYMTAITFSLANGVILYIRIRSEEQALLTESANYATKFQGKKRFWFF